MQNDCSVPSLQAKVLMRGVDDVSLGLSGPADTLLLSARSGDPGLLSEQGKAITDLASSLGNIAQDALEGSYMHVLSQHTGLHNIYALRVFSPSQYTVNTDLQIHFLFIKMCHRIRNTWFV